MTSFVIPILCAFGVIRGLENIRVNLRAFADYLFIFVLRVKTRVHVDI